MPPDLIKVLIDGSRRDAAVLVAGRDTTNCAYTNPRDFFMPRSALGARFEEVVAKWYAIFDKVAVPSQLALGVMASDKLWAHVEFLSLIQALEGFHRALLEGLYMPSADYQKVQSALMAAIPSNVSPGHRDSLRSRVRYGNDISLAKRLDVLADRLSSSVRTLIFGDDGRVPRRWIDTRNYYTHWDEDLRKNILDGQGLIYENQRIRHFLRALYLDLAGVTQDAIFHALCNYSRASQSLAQINAIKRRQTDPTDTSGLIMTILKQGTEAPFAGDQGVDDAKSPT